MSVVSQYSSEDKNDLYKESGVLTPQFEMSDVQKLL